METTDIVRTITSKELAAVFDVTDRHIRRLCAAGRLPHHRVGTSIRFTPGDQAAIEAMTAVVPSSLAGDECEDAERDGQRSPSMAAAARPGSSGGGDHRLEGAA